MFPGKWFLLFLTCSRRDFHFAVEKFKFPMCGQVGSNRLELRFQDGGIGAMAVEAEKSHIDELKKYSRVSR